MRTKAESIAARLAAATGSEVHRTEGPAGVRLEANLPPELSEAAHEIVLSAIAEADAYGHERTEDRGYVWALVHETPNENPAAADTAPGVANAQPSEGAST
ncbi:hypothetical protein [Streptomyces chiangmaiensis]|uniref:Uncharacterized protein n=1 Tax=Streptomyces chiangmaiensis TaxID=766497 RepID=A0ABU7FVS8_9ACTN|nr:hypothetical protein [Streptomyces chiangmaiensis]MED7828046.1 hypothetical protein [Streptomyces chiangmaiensis]